MKSSFYLSLFLSAATASAFLPRGRVNDLTLRCSSSHCCNEDKKPTCIGLAAASPNDNESSQEQEKEKHWHPMIVPSQDYREWIPSAKRKKPQEQSSKKKQTVVMKFGGSSLANAERIQDVADLIRNQRAAGCVPRAVVCSAMGRTTDLLLNAGAFALEGRVNMEHVENMYRNAMAPFDFPKNTVHEVNALLQECHDLLRGVSLLEELSPKTMDQLVSYGEQCSVRIVAARLNQIGVPAQAFDAWDVGVLTDSNFGNAKILPESEERIRQAFKNKIDPSIVAVVTGFIGRDAEGRITTLGRGGDLSATYIGASLPCDEIQIYKDVDGVLTSDPRVVPHAVPVAELSYDEASELAHFGSQVLHPAAMGPALKHMVPVRVKNSLNPAAVGTTITQQKETHNLVTAITYQRDVKLLDIRSTQALGAYGFLANVFCHFEKHKLSVDVLASSEVSISLTFDKKQDEMAIESLVHDLSGFADVSVKTDKSILTLIADVPRSSQVLSTVFRVFADAGIKVNMMSQGASKVNISFIVDSDCLDAAILALHKCFFEGSCPADYGVAQHAQDEQEFLAHTRASFQEQNVVEAAAAAALPQEEKSVASSSS